MNRGYAWVLSAGLVLSGTTAIAAPAPAETRGSQSAEQEAPGQYNTCQRMPETARFRITLPEEAELEDLVRWMSSVSCLKFIIDPALRAGKVTVMAPEPVTLTEAYGAFYSSLMVMGLTVEPSGPYYKIVEVAGAERKTVPVTGPGAPPPNDDRFVTHLYRPHDDLESIATVLDHFTSKEGSVKTAGAFVVITDTGANVRRILKIAKRADPRPAKGKQRVFLFQLQHADPEGTAAIVREVFRQRNAGSTSRPKTRPRSSK